MSEALDGVFNPFFSTTGADGTIVSMTQIGMLTYGYENGEVVVAFGDDEAVVVKDYISKYDSASDTTTYTFVLKNGILFSDGHPLTIEDVLASYRAARVSGYYQGRFTHVQDIRIEPRMYNL